jgi:hypothetical protein
LLDGRGNEDRADHELHADIVVVVQRSTHADREHLKKRIAFTVMRGA